MCWKTTCETCSKITWAGCGRHIDSALSGVKEAELCTCEAQMLTVKCSGCKDTFRAPTSGLLKRVMAAHYELAPACNPHKSADEKNIMVKGRRRRRGCCWLC